METYSTNWNLVLQDRRRLLLPVRERQLAATKQMSVTTISTSAAGRKALPLPRLASSSLPRHSAVQNLTHR